jgi:hypothetical protein
VHDAALVSVRESVRHLLPVEQDLLERESSFGEAHTERLAKDELHGDEGLSLRLADLMDRADVGVVELGGHTGLAQQADAGGFVGESSGGEDLQGHLAVEPRVPCPPNLAHAPRAEQGDDVVRPKASTGRQRHGGRSDAILAQ